MIRRPPRSPLFPYTPLSRSEQAAGREPQPGEPLGDEDEPRRAQLRHENEKQHAAVRPFRQPVGVPRRPRRQGLGPEVVIEGGEVAPRRVATDRKSTRLNSSHGYISYAV